VPAADRAAHQRGKVRIVDRILGKRARVFDASAQLAKRIDYDALGGYAAMIAADDGGRGT
jgi:hypothetical protein